MSLRDRRLEDLTKSDVQVLVSAETPEGQELEYKRDLPRKSDDEKREFLADVTAFANSSGGIILFGVDEAGGIAVAAPGVPMASMDAEILRLENLLRDGVEERIPGIRMQAVAVSATEAVLLIRVPRSWAGPHMVSYKGSTRFFGRNARGKYQMNVGELRRAFDESSATHARLRSLRAERLAAIIADETPVPLYGGPKVVVHVVPMSALSGVAQVDIAGLDPYDLRFSAFGADRYHEPRYNFDGLAASPPIGNEDVTVSYAQLFRTGTIEAVDAGMIYEEAGRKHLYSITVERRLIEAVEQYLGTATKLGLDGPFVIMISLAGIRGYQVIPDTRNRHWDNFRTPIDRDVLLLPEVVTETAGADIPAILRPTFDTLWQSAGWPGSYNYDDDGKHISLKA